MLEQAYFQPKLRAITVLHTFILRKLVYFSKKKNTWRADINWFKQKSITFTVPETVYHWSIAIKFSVFVLLQTVLRIWDCLFYEGSKILFRVALTLIHHNEVLIQQAQSLPDICQTFKQITSGPFVDDCHTFMQVKATRGNPLPTFSVSSLKTAKQTALVIYFPCL